MSRWRVLDGLTMYMDKLGKAYETGGRSTLKREIERQIDDIDGFEDIPLKVGVLGRSGTGKSTFLNAIRDLQAGGSKATCVGVTETTRRVQEFRHPRNPKLILCDAPGAGTPDFPLEKYFEDPRIKFDTFDMIIVMFCSRFTESEVHLLLSVISSGMFCMFVRTKVALDIENERKAKRKLFAADPHAVERVVDKVRKDCYDNLKELPENISVYVIDNFDHENKYLDYDNLSNRLTCTYRFSELKKEAFVEMACHDAIRHIEDAQNGRKTKEVICNGKTGEEASCCIQ